MKALISAFIDNNLQTVVIYHEEDQQDLLGKLVNNFNTYGKVEELFKGHILSIDKDGTIHPIDFNLGHGVVSNLDVKDTKGWQFEIDAIENWGIKHRYMADIDVKNVLYGWRKVDVKTNVTKKYEWFK